MQNQDKPSLSYQEDEIDLFELASALWQRKWMIIGVTSVVVLLAFAYLFVTPKVYESKILISEVQSADVAQLNAGQVIFEQSTPEYTSESAYNLFQTRLQSRTLAMDYFSEHVQPVYRSNGNETGSGKLLERFLKSISVSKAGSNSDYLTVAHQYTNPKLTAEWLNGYVRYIELKTKEELVNAAALNKSLIVNKYEKEMASLRVIYSRRLQDNIIRLEEAYKIAKKLNFKAPISTNALLNSQDESPLYMKGYDVLGAEIESLKSRKEVDPFIEKIRPIQEKINYLESVLYNSETLNIVNIDGWALSPEYSIKPKKVLILVLAGLLGGMLGVFVSLIMWSVSKKRLQDKA